MRREEWLLHRLRYETMDWCQAVQSPYDTALTAHRNGIHHRPEVWNDG